MQKRSDGTQCLGCRVLLPDAINEPVRHSHPYVELGVDTGSKGALDILPQVVEQHLIISHVDADWGSPTRSP